MKARMMEAWRRFWQARSDSERRALAWMAAVVLLAGLAQMMWSVEQSRQRLRQQLPLLAADTENMRQSLAEWQRLETGAQGANAPAPAEQHRQAEQRLAALGGLSGAWLGPMRWRLSGTVSFDAWVVWLGEMQQDFRLSVERAQVTPAGPGLVRIEVELVGEAATP